MSILPGQPQPMPQTIFVGGEPIRIGDGGYAERQRLHAQQRANVALYQRLNPLSATYHDGSVLLEDLEHEGEYIPFGDPTTMRPHSPSESTHTTFFPPHPPHAPHAFPPPYIPYPPPAPPPFHPNPWSSPALPSRRQSSTPMAPPLSRGSSRRASI